MKTEDLKKEFFIKCGNQIGKQRLFHHAFLKAGGIKIEDIPKEHREKYPEFYDEC